MQDPRLAVLHEIGHSIGLNHCATTGVMNGPVGITGDENSGQIDRHLLFRVPGSDFTPAEKLAIKLMFQRLPGNQYRDYDVYVRSESRR